MMSHAALISVCLVSMVLAGCGGSSPRFTSKNEDDASGTYRLKGIASYYADEFHNRTTANGETFNMNDLTAASPNLPFNSIVRVTNLENDRSVVVRINDRGPFKEGRIIDLSLEAAKQIGLIANGTATVQLEILELGAN